MAFGFIKKVFSFGKKEVVEEKPAEAGPLPALEALQEPAVEVFSPLGGEGGGRLRRACDGAVHRRSGRSALACGRCHPLPRPLPPRGGGEKNGGAVLSQEGTPGPMG